MTKLFTDYSEGSPRSEAVDYKADWAAGQYTVKTFEARDSKGRTVGASVHVFTLRFRACTPDETNGYGFAPGTHYCYHATSLRDGKVFGATHGDCHFSDEAERDAAVAKYFRNAERSAAKGKK